MMKKINLFLIIAFTVQYCFSQISEKVEIFSKKLDTISYAESSHIGVGGESSEVFSYFRKVDSIATNEELFHFAKNGSNSLRLYSSQSLVDRKDIERINYLYKFYLMYPIKISYQSGCTIYNLGITQTIRDRLKFVEHIIEDDVIKDLDTREAELKIRVKNNKLFGEELEHSKYILKELKSQKEWFKHFGAWTKDDLEKIINNFDKLDKLFEEEGFVFLD